jgi:outer membrane protein insertion porin family
MGRLELEIPVSSNIRSLGFRPSAFIDLGSVWNLTKPGLADRPGICVRADNPATPANEVSQVTLNEGQTCAGLDQSLGAFNYLTGTGFKEFFVGDSIKPRLSIGIGVNWTSPFGPLRIDIAKALLTQEGDETKLFSFNVGTQF